MQDHAVEGYEHIEEAAGVLSGVVTDLFALPGAAQDRAIAQREALGEEDHGDDLLCGCWAAAGAATALLELAGRHMDALLHLSGQHPGFASSAEVLARSALEGLFRMSWLLAPENVLDREHRWFALKKEEARFYKNLGQIDQAGLDEWIADLESQAAFVGGDPITGVPSASCTMSGYDTQ